MKRLLATFLLAFSLGTVTAVYLVRRPPQGSAQVVATQAPETEAAREQPADEEGAASDAAGDSPGAAWPAEAGSAEQVLYAQPQMMDAAIDRLAARTPGRPNIYVIAFAGDGEENVFRNEAEYVRKLFDERFDAIGHTIVLINNPSTLTRYPIASLTNLQTAVDAIATRIEPAQDVLLLFLTSHGSPEHELYVALDPLPLDQIDPQDLADLFAGSAIRNKVVVISACYSGGFIDALKNPTTMVITAARADRSSFGCGTKSAITYFGRAFFADGLNDTDSFTAAFAEAHGLIDQWEKREGDTHSEPQIATAAPIEKALQAWRDGIHLGPRVPFAAPSARPARAERTRTAPAGR